MDHSLLCAANLTSSLPSLEYLSHEVACVLMLFFSPSTEHELLKGKEHVSLMFESPPPKVEPGPSDIIEHAFSEYLDRFLDSRDGWG